MSIIQTVEATPNRVFTIFSALIESPSGINRDDLERCCTPNNLRKDGKTSLFTQTYNECKKLGFVVENEGVSVLSEKVKVNRDITNEEIFNNFLENAILSGRDDVVEYSKKFLTTTAWFLTLNPLQPLNFGPSPANEIKKNFGDKFFDELIFGSSSNNSQQFYYWLRFFGFARIIGGEKNTFVYVDPTTAIEKRLRLIFQNETVLSVEKFLENLSSNLPVFEKGMIRSLVEESGGNSENERNSRLSYSTSFALRRLKESKKIDYDEGQSDGAPMLHPLGDVKTISHIKIGKNFQ